MGYFEYVPVSMSFGTSGRRGKGMINFNDQEVKGQGHTRPEIDLDAWQRRQSRPRWVE